MFIDIPYLPSGPVELAVSGFPVPGVRMLPPPEIKALPPALRRHADLGLCPLGGGEAVCPPDTYAYYSELLEPYGFSVICGGQALGVSYPADTAYNVVVAGKFAVLNPAVCDRLLLRELERRFEIIAVKQGYAKCSVAPVGENAVITGDAGIASAAERAGLETLLISNAGVALPPYANGFFGGACGLAGPNLLAVNGSLSAMDDGKIIREFLDDHGVSALELSPEPPFDTGSLIPLTVRGDNISRTQKY